MKKKFKAESQRLLDLMINSIYTHKEIFLREIISNASDAIDKMCYLALTDPSIGMSRKDFEIILTLDKENRTLTVSDNGIGMNEEDLEKNLGTIAFSGSKKFSEEIEKADKEKADTAASLADQVDIIGQFGVGFYSAFMVADKVEVVSRKYGEDKAYRWISEGAGGYTIEEAERDSQGTDVIMHIREDGEEKDEFSQYMREYPIYKLVKKYSDYIRFPIKMLMPQPKIKEGSDPENPEFEEVFEYEVFNSMVPLWQRKRAEVTREEYEEFYKQTFQDELPPLETMTVSVEGMVSYDALMFIPEQVPYKYYSDDFSGGLQLYSSGVLIMDKCKELLPEYFNFVKGVVDSPDLSLNISREMLQHDRQVKLISKNLEKKIRGKLEELRDKDREKYEKFYKSFGRQLKLCALDDFGKYKEELQDFLMFYSSTENKLVTLAEYVDRMKEDQEYIYYAAGDSLDAVDKMPQTEILKERGIEILYFTDNTDEFIPDMFRKYREKSFMSVIDGDFDLGDGKNDEKMTETFKDTFDFVKEALGDKVDVVKATTKLRTHPVCLSSGDGITFEMEKYFTAVNPDLGMKAKRILELNVDHAAFLALDRARLDDPERAKKMCEVLFNQALLIAGLPINDPSGYTDIVCSFF
ncbi:MAG: molecular chaperone HtpG [Mogibacterium sp.]|nr:molecular chaperone HtpG [Mogibacterium sp.]MBQ6389823.1 molecular chaperone HtpG [Mogibacterium sp.]